MKKKWKIYKKFKTIKVTNSLWKIEKRKVEKRQSEKHKKDKLLIWSCFQRQLFWQ